MLTSSQIYVDTTARFFCEKETGLWRRAVLAHASSSFVTLVLKDLTCEPPPDRGISTLTHAMTFQSSNDHTIFRVSRAFAKSFFSSPSSLRGSRPVLSFISCENGPEVGVSMKILRPTDRSQNFGRTKSLSDSETGRSVAKNRSDKVNY